MFSTNIKKWSEAHVFYNSWQDDLTTKNDHICKKENEWKNFVLNETVNGELYLKNKLFDQLSDDHIYLAHLTPNIHNIFKNNCIYPSGGCLVGSVYSIPITKIGKEFRLHNLGSFIYGNEIPRITGDIPKLLVVKIKLQKENRNKLIGVDYLRLGEIHFNLYKNLEYLLSHQERNELEKTCVLKIQELSPLLIVAQNSLLNNNNKNIVENFFTLYNKLIKENPILSYLLFEVFCEFIALFQKCKLSDKWKAYGEIYTWHFKESVFSLANDSYFNLKKFQPTIKDIYDYISKQKIVKMKYEKMEKYFFDRLVFLINARLFNGKVIDDWRKMIFSFDSLMEYFSSLLGHTIHRELRNFGRFPYFYFYFDQLKALEVWNYWNHNGVIVPFNGLFPKGEVGINPAYPEFEYEVYRADIKKRVDDELFLNIKNKTEVKFIPKLVDIKFTTLRNKHHEKK